MVTYISYSCLCYFNPTPQLSLLMAAIVIRAHNIMMMKRSIIIFIAPNNSCSNLGKIQFIEDPVLSTHS